MPKINVYLPDELADAVKQANVPVSAVCQRALEQAVRRVTAIRETTVTELTDEDLANRLPQFTPRAQRVVQLAVAAARSASAPGVGTGHLLDGMIAEGANMALLVLRALEVEPEHLRRDLDRQSLGDEPVTAASSGDGPNVRRFTDPAANALELTVIEATTLGHNYIGCEHLMLGLVAEPDGVAGRVLRARGVDSRIARRAAVAALAGYVHLHDNQAQAGTGQTGPGALMTMLTTAVREEMRPLAERIEKLEQRVGTAADD